MGEPSPSEGEVTEGFCADWPEPVSEREIENVPATGPCMNLPVILFPAAVSSIVP